MAVAQEADAGGGGGEEQEALERNRTFTRGEENHQQQQNPNGNVSGDYSFVKEYRTDFSLEKNLITKLR